MSWFYLFLGICLDVSGITSMKLSRDFTKIVPSIMIFIFYLGCFYCMTKAVKKLDIGIVYAVWSGTGVALVTTVGIIYFQEPLTILKSFFLLLIIIGVIGLYSLNVNH